MIYINLRGPVMNAHDKNLEALSQAVKEMVREKLADAVKPQMVALKEVPEELQEVKDRLKEVKGSGDKYLAEN